MGILQSENRKTTIHYGNCTINSPVLKLIHICLFFAFSVSLAQEPAKKTTTVKENSDSKKTLTYEVVFEMNKSYLNLAAKDKLYRIYKVYANNISDTLNIRSEGAIDKLFKERSIAVTNYLISKGVPSAHIRYVDFGKVKVGNGIEVIIK